VNNTRKFSLCNTFKTNKSIYSSIITKTKQLKMHNSYNIYITWNPKRLNIWFFISNSQ
jgi:hypothetical protein